MKIITWNRALTACRALLLVATLGLAACPGESTGAGGGPAAGAMSGGQPEGVFFMTRAWVGTGGLEKTAYYFHNGHVYQNPTGFTAEALAALPPGQRGTFTADGSTMTIKWADNQTSTSRLEDVHDSAFNWDTGIFLGVRPFASPQALAGSFEGGNSVSFGGGGMSASNDLTFNADGTYSQAGAATGAATSDASTTTVGGSSGSAGHWQLTGWVLTLTDAQGKTAQGVAFPFETDDNTKQVNRFYFQNIAYKRL